MPDVGVEYRYPFVDVESWGTQTIEPIAQLILRPNETEIGKFPNEDAQSVVFSDANLFSIDKFSGWDRVEGGGRAQRRLAIYRPGQQCRLLQRAVRAVLSALRIELLCGDRSDQYRPGERSRQDSFGLRRPHYLSAEPDLFVHRPRAFRSSQTFTPERLEFEARANFDRWTLQLMYGDYARQPEIGFCQPARGNSRRRLGQGDAELGPARLRSAMTLPSTNSTRPGSASATPTIACCCR